MSPQEHTASDRDMRKGVEEVEEVYECAPVQEGMLVGELSKLGTVYNSIKDILVTAGDGAQKIDVFKLRQAWQQVVDRHSILRTVFVESVGSDRLFDQVVLRKTEPAIVEVKVSGSQHDLRSLSNIPDELSFVGKGPPHRLTIFTGNDTEVLCRLEINHTISDGTSSAIILRDWARAYAGTLPQAEAPRYSRYIAFLQKQDNEAHLHYWRELLYGIEPCYFPSMVDTTAAKLDTEHSVLVPDIQSSDLRAFCRKLGVTLFNVMQVAWALVLRSYTGMDDVCFGYLTSGRDLPIDGVEDMAGPLINMLTCRAQLNRSCSVADLINELQEQYYDSNGHQTTSLGSVQRALKLSGARLFNSIINVQHSRSGGSSNVKVSFKPIGSRENDEFDVSLSVFSSPEDIAIRLKYAASRFDKQHANNIASTLSSLLARMVQQPDESISSSYFLDASSKDEAQILAWNNTPLLTVEQCVHHVIEKQVRSQPSALAVCAWDGEMTYAELDERAERLARLLVSMGVRPDTLVPLCFEKSAWYTVALLAVLKAGGAFVPLDPSQPLQRIASMIRQCTASVVLSSREQAHSLNELGVPVVQVSAASVKELPPASGNYEVDVRPNNLVYAIFTSGSTGVPKAVAIEHRSYCSGAAARKDQIRIHRGSRTLQVSAYSFDTSMEDHLTGLMAGACLCVPSEAERMEDLDCFIATTQVNRADLIPSFAATLPASTISSLMALVVGGEPMTQAQVQNWAGQVHLINAYGPSECCVTSTVNDHVTDQTNARNIGRAIESCHTWIVNANDHDRLMPIGAVGELVLEGPILARGYLQDEEKTAAAFVSSPRWALAHSPSQPRRFYKTGDLVRYNADGTIHFVGRKDTQVKVRGQRLELGEIEHHVTALREVKHALALVPRDGPYKQQIAVVVRLEEVLPNDACQTVEEISFHVGCSTAAAQNLQQIREQASQLLPSYMEPSIYISITAMPKLSSGKLDRKQVMRWVEQMNEDTRRLVHETLDGEASSQPLNELQRRLRDVWSSVLNVPADNIGLNSSFVTLGGDSISAMVVVARCRGAGIQIGARDMLQYRKLSELADRAKVDSDQDSRGVLAVDDLNGPYELSPIQRLHFQFAPRGDNDNQQGFFLTLSRQVSIVQLRLALEAVVSAHSALRTRFHCDAQGVWQQQVTDDVASSFEVRETRVADQKAVGAVVASTREMINFRRGPILAAALVSVGDEQSVFFAAHHLVIDLVSWRIILLEIEELLVHGTAPAPEQVSFKAWSLAQAEHIQNHFTPSTVLASKVLPADLGYWGLTDKLLRINDVVRESFVLSQESSQSLLGSCNTALRTTPLELFLAALTYSFSQTFPDRPTPAVFSEGHGREPWEASINLSRTVGWFTTMYPVLVKPSQLDEGVIGAVCAAKDARRSLVDNGWPYFSTAFLTDAGRKAFAAHWPMEILFNYQEVYQQLERPDALFRSRNTPSVARTPEESASLHWIFNVSATVKDGRLEASLTYNKHIRQPNIVKEWARRYEAALEELATVLPSLSPMPTVSDFPLLSTTNDSLWQMAKHTLPTLGINDVSEIEDIYPCSPIQEGLQVSQIDSGGTMYKTVHLVTVEPTYSGGCVDIQQLRQAWQQVVDRHSILRTVFVESVGSDRLFDQVVLKRVEATAAEVKTSDSQRDLRSLSNIPDELSFAGKRPPHRLTIFTGNDTKALCRLEINHILTDGSSYDIILRDWARAYAGPLPQAEAPRYSRYIAFLQKQDNEAHLHYWRELLYGIEPCYFPSIVDTTAAKLDTEHSVLVPDIQSSDLRAFCRKLGVTLFNVMQVAWALVLRSYTGMDDVCFGYLTSGRDLPIDGVEDMAGPLINMLTCRAQLNRSCSVADLINELQRQYYDSNGHQTTSLGSVQRALKLSGARLFNTTINVQHSRKDGFSNEKAFFKPTSGYGKTEFDVSLSVSSSPEDIVIRLKYAASRFDEQHANNIASTLSSLLARMVQRPDESISSSYFLDASSKDVAQILAWNNTPLLTVEQCVHHVIEKQVRSQPSALAVCAWDGEMTYAELDERAERLARLLVSMGVRPDTLVPLCFEKSAWYTVALLAVLKAGGAFVPLDPSQPLQRIASMIRQCTASVVLSSREQAHSLNELGVPVVQVSAASVKELPPASGNYEVDVRPNNLVYAIFTSGSTGVPKAVAIEHRSYCSGAAARKDQIRIHRGSRVLQFSSYAFDVSMDDHLLTLMVGGCLFVPSGDKMLDSLEHYLTINNVNWLQITPSVAMTFSPDNVPSLVVMVLIGEAMTSSVVRTWANALLLINAYGPAECSVQSTINDHVMDQTNARNIGRAIESCHTWIVNANDHDRLMPIGAVGELVLEGPILARGYLQDEEKTAAAFVSSPQWALAYMTSQPRRFYKTGDLVRYNADGTIHFVGRKDTQVKVRGQRLELGEIEHHVTALREVKHALALVPRDGPYKQQIAVVVRLEEVLPNDACQTVEGISFHVGCSTAAAQNLQQIREQASQLLPSYMEPSIYISITTMPKLSSGKLDRKQVMRWVEQMNEDTRRLVHETLDGEASSQPLNELQRRLRDVWSSVLNVPADNIGLNSSFVTLGGDSISAMVVVARCRGAGIQIGARDMLQYRKLSELADRAKVDSDQSSRGVLAVDDLNGPYELSPIQRLHFQFAPRGDNSNQQGFFLTLSRQVSIVQLRLALEAVVSAHSALRTRFHCDAQGVWQQQVTDDVAGSFEARESRVADQAAVGAVVASTREMINFRRGPILAAALVSVGDEQSVFFVAHHLVIDLISWRIILLEIEELLVHGTAPAPEQVSFKAWSLAQAKHIRKHFAPSTALASKVLPADLGYWGLTDKLLRINDVVRESFVLSQESSQSLLGSCNTALRTTPLELFLAALTYSFSQTFPDRPTPAVFSEGHGREPWEASIDLSRTVGWFTTMYPVLVKPSQLDEGVIGAVCAAKDSRRSLVDNGWPYFSTAFLTDAGRKAFAAHWPMEILFNYQEVYQQLERPDALFRSRNTPSVARTPEESASLHWIFNVSATVKDGRLEASLTYNKHIRQPNMVKEWARRYEAALEELATVLPSLSPMPTVSDFPLLSTTNDSLWQMAKHTLPTLGINNVSEIEDIYPCSPIQEGLQVSQIDSGGTMYKTVHLITVEPTYSGGCVDIQQLRQAWQQVVDRHSILRTVFVESVGSDRLFDQVVLKRVEATAAEVKTSDSQRDLRSLSNIPDELSFAGKRPPHRLTIFTGNDTKALCRLEINHILTDGSSYDIILRDWARAYAGTLPQAEAPRYSRYIAFLQKQDNEAHLHYWRELLYGIEPCYFPSIVDTTAAKLDTEHSVLVPDVQSSDLRAFCRKLGVTLFNVMQVAWALVLRSYTGMDDVCFGYLTSGRDLPIDGVEDMAGPLINMLTCRAQLNRSWSVADLINELQEQYYSSNGHQTASLGSVQRALKLSGARLFNTTINVQHSRKDGVSNEKAFFKPTSGYGKTEFDVSLSVSSSPEDIVIRLKYAASRFDEQHANNIASTFSALLARMVQQPDESISSSYFLDASSKDEAQILAWNNTPLLTVEQCVHHLIEKQVHLQPSALAVCAWDGEMTYTELDERAERLARLLVSMGVRPDTLVPLCFEKSAWYTVALLAVLKAGGAFVPLDPSQPLQRIASMIRQCTASVVLSSREQAHSLNELGVPVVQVSAASVKELPPASGNYEVDVRPNNLVYAIFTSGSTGVPKAVAVEHRSYCSGAAARKDQIRIHRGSRVLQFSSYTFDASIEEHLLSFSAGACVVIPSNYDLAENIASSIAKMQVSWALLVPSVVSQLPTATVLSLSTLMLGGEPVTPAQITEWAAKLHLVIAYGPTEGAVISTVNDHVTDQTNARNIGRAIESCHTWIVNANDHDRLMPIGAVGELVLEGPILARGYLQDEEKTAAAFVPSPRWALAHSPSQPRRFYKTGDLVRYNADGTIHFVGRKDTQVKVRGQRLELGEIEHHVTALREVKHALALVPRDGPYKQQIAVVVRLEEVLPNDVCQTVEGISFHVGCSTAAAQNLQQIREQASQLLPSYMEPSIYISVTAMPTLSSGKLDRKQVMRWVEQMNEDTRRLVHETLDGEASSQPLNELQRRLRDVWSSVLNVPADNIGLNSSFVTLGGDSISAMVVVARCRGAGIQIGARDMLQYRKLSELADRAKVDSDQSSRGVLAVDDLNGPYELSPIQRLHFHFAPKGDNDNQQGFFLTLSRQVSIVQLRLALEAVVSAHSALRTRFHCDAQGVWQQQVTDDVAGSFEVHESRVADQAAVEAVVASTREMINFRRGPILAAALVSVGDEQSVFFVAHHLVIDLVSWRIILLEIEELLVHGTAPAPEQVSFKAWSLAQAKHIRKHFAPSTVLASKVLPADLGYWGLTDKLLRINDVVRESFVLSQESSQSLLGSCNTALRTTPLELFLAALTYSFSQTFPDRPTPAVFSEGHGREPWEASIDLSRTVGWFTTMYPVLVKPSQLDEGVVRAVCASKDSRRSLVDNGWPYFSTAFLTDAGRKAFAAHWPMEILFNYQEVYQQLERPDALFRSRNTPSVARTPEESASLHWIFNVSATVKDGRLEASLTYNKHIRQPNMVKEWARRYEAALEELATVLPSLSPMPTVSDFPLLSTTNDSLWQMAKHTLPTLGINNVSEIEDIYPCSPIQEGLQVSQIDSGGTMYKTVHLITVEPTYSGGCVDIQQLRQAWQQVVDRHSILRTVFVESVGSDRLFDQVVLSKTEAAIVEIKDTGIQHHLKLLSNIPDELSFAGKRPPHRLTIFTGNDTKALCRLEINHILTDGSSYDIILRDWARAYAGTLPQAEASRYSRYIAFLQKQDNEAHLHYWRELLSGIEPCYFPFMANTTAAKLDTEHSVLVPDVQSSDLRAFCRKLGVTLFNVMQVAWALVLRSYTGMDDVCFGYLTSGRDLPIDGVEDMAGPLINMLTCRAQLNRSWSVADLINELQKQYYDSNGHQTTSLGSVQRALKLSGARLFNTTINVQHSRKDGVSNEKASFKPTSGYGKTEFDVSLSVSSSPEDIVIRLKYAASRFDEQHVNNIASTFSALLARMVQRPDESILSSCFLDASSKDEAQILAWNNTPLLTVEQCVHHLIEKQVRSQPSALAVCAWDGEMTYTELDERAERLARLLVSMGVRPDTLVPLCFEKSAWYTVALLAVLKAGGAFVPLDPSQPLQRIASMIRQCTASVVLSSREQAHSLNELGVPVSWGRAHDAGPGPRLGSQVHLINVYGPSECCVTSTVNDHVTDQTNARNIGRAIESCHTWIVNANDHDRLMPIGAVGELVLEGPILARGYLQDEEKTAAAFVPSPRWALAHSPSQPRRFYKTGDLVRYNADGTIHFVGRKDTRSSAPRSKARTRACPAGWPVQAADRSCGAFGRGASERRVSAVEGISFHVGCSTAAAQNLQQIREQASQLLPSYMEPSIYISVTAMPTLSSGKLDRKQVMRWVEQMNEDTRRLRRLRDVWSSVLNVPADNIGLNSSFVTLEGLDFAMAVVARCRGAGIQIGARDMLQYRKLSELADRAKVDSDQSSRGVLAVDDLNGPYELSPIQRLHFQFALQATTQPAELFLMLSRQSL
ncbi:hypothetical protein B0O99DRAFT_695700 [Bisporella sp. PMI_857]|nr:hypothetical protein B0O99DRAFT_695700 [Bisporella sp. PMI_857]